MSGKTTRDFESSISIDAPAATVWEVVGEVANAPQWASSVVKVLPLGGRTRNGTIAFNVNKMGLAVWPTASRVVDYVPGKRLANQVINGTVWVFELAESSEGPGTTILTEYRETPGPVRRFWGETVPKLTKGRFQFDEVQNAGVSSSLHKIKELAEQRAVGGR